jgi:hypothetical protein
MTFVLILLGVFVGVMMFSACKVASDADRQMEQQFERWLQENPEEKEKLMNQHEALY